MTNHDHFILLCEKCNKVISQCRCAYLDKTRKYGICDECLSNINNVDQLINQIEKIRARNNKNWMNILRLAIQYAPEQTKIIIQDIGKCDAEINKLTKELGGDG